MTCRICGEEKSLFDFKMYQNQTTPNMCKSCHNKKEAERRAKRTPTDIEEHYQKIRARRYQLKKFGITLEQYECQLSLQQGGCAICKQPCSTDRALAVDHNHQTNQFRALLCYRCNTVLGLINEDEDILIDMIEYIKKYTEKVG